MKNEPGSFCWLELTTSDRKAAQSFYTSLFGWTPDEMPMDGGEPYVTLQSEGKKVGALYQDASLPTSWLSYVAVASADDTAKKARDLGGNVMKDPFDVMDLGRMTMITDPQGGVFAIWQAMSHPGIEVRGEVNTMVWDELMTSDIDGARKFYGPLFNWELKESPGYTEVHLGGKGIGGLMQIDPQMEGMPTHWHPYFRVEDTDATLKKAQDLGVTEWFGPHQAPGVGRFAIMKDPQGATFAVIQTPQGM